jgi:hypothetical protein
MVSAAMAPAPALAMSGFTPSFSVTAYCGNVRDAAGGARQAERDCIEKEKAAGKEIAKRDIPDDIWRLCYRVSAMNGGSYDLFNTCVKLKMEPGSSVAAPLSQSAQK